MNGVGGKGAKAGVPGPTVKVEQNQPHDCDIIREALMHPHRRDKRRRALDALIRVEAALGRGA